MRNREYDCSARFVQKGDWTVGLLLEKDISYRLPEMHRVRQSFAADEIGDVREAVLAQLSRAEIRGKIRPGMKIAVAVGSRGIANIGTIVKAVTDGLRAFGAEPFVLSAMGSHGGGTPDGQRAVLAGYGVTEERLGVPVVTEVESEQIGSLKDGYGGAGQSRKAAHGFCGSAAKRPEQNAGDWAGQPGGLLRHA